MRRSLLAVLGTAALLFGAASSAQQPSPAARSAAVLVGGSNKQISLQPVSVQGGAGLNVAGGVAEISLKAVR